MERTMAKIVLFFMLFLMAFSCEKKVIDQEPEEGAYIGDYIDLFGKIIINDSLLLPNGEDYKRNWAIDISKKAFQSEDWTIGLSLVHNAFALDSILAPEESLPETFKIDNLKIVFSAKRYNYCKVLTQPDFRTAYGCKVIITKIEQYE